MQIDKCVSRDVRRKNGAEMLGRGMEITLAIFEFVCFKFYCEDPQNALLSGTM
jgi:hypothetical protein